MRFAAFSAGAAVSNSAEDGAGATAARNAAAARSNRRARFNLNKWPGPRIRPRSVWWLHATRFWAAPSRQTHLTLFSSSSRSVQKGQPRPATWRGGGNQLQPRSVWGDSRLGVLDADAPGAAAGLAVPVPARRGCARRRGRVPYG